MRVVHVGIASPRQEPGGLNRYVADLARAQTAAGVAARVLALGAGRPSEQEFRFVAQRDSSGLRRLLAFRRAMSTHRSPGAIVDVHFAWNAFAGMLGRRRRPLVVHFHGPWAAEAVSDGAWRTVAGVKRAIERWVYCRADGCVVLTDAFRTLLISTYRVSPDRVVVIPPGVDVERFSPSSVEESRRRTGLGGRGAVVVAVRRLVPRMGLADLISAMQHVEATLVIVGRGPLLEQLRAQAESLGMRERVLFRDDVDDDALPDFYRAADLSVVPTRELEGFGLVALESLACGTPVLARAQGGLVDALGGFDPRALLHDDSTAALAEQITAHLASPISTAKCLAYARRFDWAQVAATTHQFYDSVGSR